MAYVLTIEEKEGYLCVEVAGQRIAGREAEDSIHVWSKVAETCRKKKINRIVAIYHLTGKLSTMAAYDIASVPEGFGWSRQFRLGFVNLHEASWEDVEFTETVGRNRGFEGKQFAKEDDAKAWLFESHEPVRE